VRQKGEKILKSRKNQAVSFLKLQRMFDFFRAVETKEHLLYGIVPLRFGALVS